MDRRVSLKQAIQLLKKAHNAVGKATFEATQELRDDLTDSILNGEFEIGAGNAKWLKQKDRLQEMLPMSTGVSRGVDAVLTGRMAHSLGLTWANHDRFAIGAFYEPHYKTLLRNTNILAEQEAAVKAIEEQMDYGSKHEGLNKEYASTMARSKWMRDFSKNDYVERVGVLPPPKPYEHPKPGGEHQYSESWSGVNAASGSLDMPLLIMFMQKYPHLKEDWLDKVTGVWRQKWKGKIIDMVNEVFRG